MSGFSYPLAYECSNCDNETTVDWADIHDLPKTLATRGAIEVALQKRGWRRDDIKGLLFCPDCAGDAD